MPDPILWTDPAVVSLTGLPESAEASERVDQGMPISRNSDGTVFPSNNATATGAAAFGVAMTGGTAGDQVIYLRGQAVLRPNDALFAGITYVVGATGGTVIPDADLAAGQFVTYVGYALDVTNLQLMLQPTGVQRG